MKQIRQFRGKSKNGIWKYGYLSYDKNEECFKIDDSDTLTIVNSHTIGMMAESSDGKGNPIYEDDIIEGMMGLKGVVKFGKHSIKGDSHTPDYFMEGFYCDDEYLTPGARRHSEKSPSLQGGDESEASHRN